MNASDYSEIAMAEPLTRRTVHRRFKPSCRQRHDEYASRANYSTDDDHAVSREALRQRADYRHEENDQNRIDRRKSAHRRVQPEFAIAKFREHIIHLEKDGFEETD